MISIERLCVVRDVARSEMNSAHILLENANYNSLYMRCKIMNEDIKLHLFPEIDKKQIELHLFVLLEIVCVANKYAQLRLIEAKDKWVRTNWVVEEQQEPVIHARREFEHINNFRIHFGQPPLTVNPEPPFEPVPFPEHASNFTTSIKFKCRCGRHNKISLE
jgi:hypothetical protein